MKSMAALLIALAASLPAWAQTTAPAPTPAPASAAAASNLSEGEVLRFDARTGKVTLRHGPIENLQMPPMTMVFRVPDASAHALLQPGAKVRFRAEQQQGAYVLTRVEPDR